MQDKGMKSKSVLQKRRQAAKLVNDLLKGNKNNAFFFTSNTRRLMSVAGKEIIKEENKLWGAAAVVGSETSRWLPQGKQEQRLVYYDVW